MRLANSVLILVDLSLLEETWEYDEAHLLLCVCSCSCHIYHLKAE